MEAADSLFLVDGADVQKVPRLEKSHKAFDEAWVRDLIHTVPALLPIEDVIPDGGVFVPIDAEVGLGKAGAADVLGVTTGGYPVVVETKLWRNPQSRREVVAQTIDYVKEIARFNYAKFEELWSACRGGGANTTLFEAACAASPEELDEAEFADRIGRACKRGDVLGFIVGDGIRHGLTELVEHLGRDSSHLRYTLTLLELRCYEMPGGALAVSPSVVREITPVERAYIRIEAVGGLADQLGITSVARAPDRGGGPSPRTTLTEEEYWAGLKGAIGEKRAQQLKEFVEAVQRSDDLELDYKQRALMLKVPDPDGVAVSASAFAITNRGTAYNSRHAVHQADKWGIAKDRVREIMAEFHGTLHEVCPGFRPEGIHHINPRQFVPVGDFIEHLDRIAKAIHRVATALRTARGGD